MLIPKIKKLTFLGLISSSGADAAAGTGGASGGSVWIETGGFYGSGSIEANGGSGEMTFS